MERDTVTVSERELLMVTDVHELADELRPMSPIYRRALVAYLLEGLLDDGEVDQFCQATDFARALVRDRLKMMAKLADAL